jgi:hypothetical protein
MSKDIQINDRTYNDISTVTVTTTSGDTANFYDSSTTTATSSEIVSGKTVVLKNGMTTGTMSDNGTISGEIKTKDESVSVPSGYYSGNGSVSIADTEKAKLVANNIRHGVSILGVEGTMESGTTIVSGGGEMTFDTVADMVNNGTNNVSDGTPVKCLGYYKKNDDGGAQYVVKYIHSTELASYPWAIDLGELPEYENQIEYNLDKTPKRDEDGNYIYAKDSTGKTIALMSKKHLYSVINETTVNYSQFGAKLDGTTDDYQPIYLAHKYQHDHYTIESYSGRRRYYIKVENHKGIIHKDNDEPIVCSGNIDLSGSQLLITDKNATWFGFYLWGDNDEDYMSYEPDKTAADTFIKDNFVINNSQYYSDIKPNSLLWLKETPYAVRDDSGYLYEEPRYELLLHTMDGILTSPFTYDWNNMGGLEIQSTLSDYNTHKETPKVTNSQLETSFTRLPATHYHFKGCDVKFATTANKYCSVLWCKCHNAHISGFNFIPDSSQMHNTVFKNTMIYIWGCYNTEVSDIVGFNASGKKEGGANATSGYVIRATNCLQLHLHDISVQGYWGATAMNCVKDIHIERVNINRLDIHNYFYNLYIDQCNLFNHAIQIGEGRGIVQITNSNFYVNKLDADSYPNAHILEFNLTYGRIFEGTVLIQNCNAYLKDPDGSEFDVCKIEFSPEAVSTLDSYKFPEVTIRDCNFYSYNSDTYLVYFMIAGKRNCKTAMSGPTNKVGYCNDAGNDANGTLQWSYLGRGIDWNSGSIDASLLNVKAGQFIRTYKTYVDSDKKTAFYDYHYFLITKDGTLPTPSESNTPSDYSGNEFTLGTATVKHVSTDYRWLANKDYKIGDYCFTDASHWFPLYCYRCTRAGHSNGYRPVHLTTNNGNGIVDGIDVYPANLDACWWEYVSTLDKFVTKSFTANMSVNKDEIILVSENLYKVLQSGTLKEVPPMDTNWLGEFVEGTAKLSFIGTTWTAKSWRALGSYCISEGSNGVKQVYKLVQHAGITSGNRPVPGNGRTIDGDIIWQETQEKATKGAWTAKTAYNVGDIVTHVGNNYKCIFDGKLELPNRTTIENISTNMTTGGDIFAFWEKGTDIPTKLNSHGSWTIYVNNLDLYRFRTFANGYFGHTGNPQPKIVDMNLVQNVIQTGDSKNPSSGGGSSSQSGSGSGSSSGGTTTSGVDCSSYTKIKTLTVSATSDGNLAGYTLGGDSSYFKKVIPNNKKIHFKAVLFCPTGVTVDYYAISDFENGRKWDNKNNYCQSYTTQSVAGGTNYTKDWDETIAVTSSDFTSDDDVANNMLTYLCCSETKVKASSATPVDLTKATLSVTLYIVP